MNENYYQFTDKRGARSLTAVAADWGVQIAHLFHIRHITSLKQNHRLSMLPDVNVRFSAPGDDGRVLVGKRTSGAYCSTLRREVLRAERCLHVALIVGVERDHDDELGVSVGEAWEAP